MRVQLQSEAAECGIACLAMVGSHYDPELTLSSLRARFNVSLKGITLRQLVDYASQLNFRARALRIELEDLSKLRVPCILHWDMSHFVVLESVRGRTVKITDPAFGPSRMRLEDCSKHFTGVALELTPEPGFSKSAPTPSVSLKQLTGPISGLWRYVSQLFVVSIALQLLVMAAPFQLQLVVDQIVVSGDQGLLVGVIVAFLAISVMHAVTYIARGWSVIYLSSQLTVQWTSRVFRHLLRLPMSYFEKRHLGDIVSRLGGVQAIQKTLTTSFVEALIDGVMALATLSIMLVYSWKLTLVVLVLIGLYLVIKVLSFGFVRARTERSIVASANQQTHSMESIRGMQSLKLSGNEASRHRVYVSLLSETADQEFSLARANLFISSSSTLVANLSRVFLVGWGGFLALNGSMTVGMLVAFLAYADQFSTRVTSLIDKTAEFRMLRLQGERLADIALAEEEDSRESAPEVDLGTFAEIQVKGVSFRYADGEPLVLDDCSFTVKRGESLAITGPSGCGKSTLGKIMLGLLRPTSGEVLIGGVDLNRANLRSYRRQIATVMQDDQLFGGTIADNIAFGSTDFSMTRVEEAAIAAALHSDIMAMPMRYQTLIGDMGSSLSGGQRQRLLLARALYRLPKIIFLDEATSQLDLANEALVNSAVSHMDITRVVIAHRQATLDAADRVLHLSNGKIAVPEVKAREDMPASEAV